MASLRLSAIIDHLRRFPRFSMIGAVVTLLSTGSNIFLLKYVHTPLIATYVLVYSVSITLSYVLNSLFTFQSSLAVHRMIAYWGVYLSSMGLGVILLKLYRAVLPFQNWVLPLLVLPFTALWNYNFSSSIMRRDTP